MSDQPPVPDANEFWTPRRFLLILSAVVLALFPKVALGLNTFFFRDFGTLGYPGGNYFRECLLHGEFPLWNSYSHCGTPFMAQMGSWYVPSWICVILPMPWSVNFPMLLHLILGGFGMYSLARRWGVGGFAASFAGFAYAFNGVSLSCFQWGNYIASLGLLPWVVICVMEAWKNGGRWIAAAAVVSALQVLTGTPELTLTGWGFLAVLWLSEVIAKEINPARSGLRVALVILIASGITMVQMLPFLDVLAHSQRDMNYDQLRWAMPGWGWANLLVPLFHNFHSYQGNWFQQGQEFLLSYYLGAGVLVLAIAGVWLRRTRLSFVLVGVALVCWIMALGNDGHLYAWVKKVFPYVGIARFPVKFTVLTSLLIPLLAAFAIQSIQSDSGKRSRRVVAIIGVGALTAIGFFIWYGRTYPFPYDGWGVMTTNGLWRAGLMLVLLGGILMLPKCKTPMAMLGLQSALIGIFLFDMLDHSPKLVPTLQSSVLAPGIWEADKRPPVRLGEGRIMISPDAEERLLHNSVPTYEDDFMGKRLAEWSNLNLLDMVPKVTGALTLRPGNFGKVERYLYYTPGVNYGQGFLDFVSTVWFSSPDNPVSWTARTNHLPVMTAGQRPVFLDDEKSMVAMTADDFDPRAKVYLPESERVFVTVSNRTTCLLSNIVFKQNSEQADVNAAETSLIVLSQTFYHLWHAEVDGQPVRMLRANVAFQALQVPAGTHHIKLIYRDPYFVTGGVISLLSIVVCGLMWFRTSFVSTKSKSV